MQPAPAAETAPAAAEPRWHRLGRWLDAHEVARTGRARPGWALLTVAVVYLLGFGLPVFAAVAHLTGGVAFGHTTRVILTVLELGLNVVAVLVAVVLLRREAPSWARPTPTGPRWIMELRAFGLAWLAIFVGTTLVRVLSWLPRPEVDPGWPPLSGLIAALLAGPTEEIVVLVVPLVFLRAARWRWPAVITAMLVLRLAYHVYYGVPAVGLMVWAVAMIVIYLRTHAVVGLIVAHSLWDVMGMVALHWSLIVAGLMEVLSLVALLVWGIVSVSLWLVRRADRRAAAAPPLVGWHQSATGHWWWWDGQRWIAPPPPEPGSSS